jgi:choline dehydrogenase
MDGGFDYVIVGGGTAGAVLAARLTERAQVRVCLLEAGGNDFPPLTRMPAGYVATVQSPRFSWCYETEPVTGLGGRRLPCPRGRVLGGSSTINGMIYVRGQREDFDDWHALGNSGWSHDELLPYFRKAFHQTRGEDHYHGQGGPIPVSDAPFDALSSAFLGALAQSGLPKNADFNGETQEGAGYYQFNISHGERMSAARGYLEPHRARANLSIETQAQVLRVLFDQDKRAVGVEVEQAGRKRIISAAAEVIVCAGAINSPQILALSGVGPGAELQALSIPVVADRRAVGENLQDHLLVRSSFAVDLPSMNRLRSPLAQAAALGRYAVSKRGPLANGPCSVGAFFRTDAALDRPDAQLHFIPCSFDVENGKPKLHRFDGMTASVYQLRPTSRGRVRLATGDARTKPRIEPAHLETDIDQQTIVRALKRQRAFFLSAHLDNVRGRELSPGAEVTSDQDWLAFARATGESSHHPCGTCRMGSDAESVVDPQLAVRGVRGLRVVDASIMPTIVSGNTHAATIAIAERAVPLLARSLT